MQWTGIKHIPLEYNEQIIIKPISDVHWGHKMCDTKAFREFINNSDNNTYFIGVGDMLDSIVVTDPRYRKSMDGCTSDDILNEQVDQLEEILAPVKDRILQLSPGNHEKTIVRKASFNPVKELCKRLDVPYAGVGWIYTLRFRGEAGRGKTVVIRGHHGWGGGSRTQGADLTKFSRDMAYYDCDVFLYGHVHKRQFDEVARLCVVGSKLIAKPKYMAICGTFQKTMSDTQDDSWAEEQGFPPVPVGGIQIKIKIKDPCPDIKMEKV